MMAVLRLVSVMVMLLVAMLLVVMLLLVMLHVPRMRMVLAVMLTDAC